jgi:aconitate hydratase
MRFAFPPYLLPLNFVDGQNAGSLGLDGTEVFDFDGLKTGAKELDVTATKADGKQIKFKAKVRINTPKEWEYYANGGVLHYMLRQMAA